mgnify:CR=1 FL=1
MALIGGAAATALVGAACVEEHNADVERARELLVVDFANTVAFCEHARKRLLAIMETFFTDTANARVLNADGTYVRPVIESGAPVRSQLFFTKEAAKRSKLHTQAPDILVPHTPKVDVTG